MEQVEDVSSASSLTSTGDGSNANGPDTDEYGSDAPGKYDSNGRNAKIISDPVSANRGK